MYEADWTDESVTREELNSRKGKVLVEFGADWCPHCQAAQGELRRLMEGNDIPHIKVTDGKGRPLGRSFRVKLWPNFVLMENGEVREQLARPGAEELGSALEAFLND